MTASTFWCHAHHSNSCGCWQKSARWWINGAEIEAGTYATLVTPAHLCPDLLTLDQIGAADNLRGRVVRLFFYCLRVWKP